METNDLQTEAAPRLVLVVAVDDTPAATHVISAAAELARPNPRIEIHLVHVLDHVPGFDPLLPLPPSFAGDMLQQGRGLLERLSETARSLSRSRIVAHLGIGTPWREVVQMATNLEADLVLVGTHDRKGLKRVAFGSVAEQIARNASCPVLLVRPKDHHARLVPEIEPPCPDCLQVQQKTQGADLWCARHTQHHPKPHLHYEVPQSFAVGSMLVRP